VNYVLFGLLGKLCGYNLEWVVQTAATTFLKAAVLLYTPAAALSAVKWAAAGWNDYPYGAGEPAEERGDCARCPGGSVASGGLTATWDNMTIL
jgi:hypothetical protein